MWKEFLQQAITSNLAVFDPETISKHQQVTKHMIIQVTNTVQVVMPGTQVLRALLLAIFAMAASPAWEREPLVPALFIFGDSLVDVGTNAFVPNACLVANMTPFGETHFHRPNGRYSNGLIPSDFFARFLGLPLLPPYLQPGADHSRGANFASAGAGVLHSTNADKRPVPFSLQVKQFQELVSEWNHQHEHAASKISKSIFLINIGSNDILAEYPATHNAILPSQFIQDLIKAYRKSIETLYQTGARKFVISGLGPLGCTPTSRLYVSAVLNTTGCHETLNQMAKNFNTQLQNAIKELQKDLRDPKFIYAKAFELYMDMIHNGGKYGFTVTDENCCGSGAYHAEVPCGWPVPPDKPAKPFLCHRPSKYVFWDFHPTQQAYLFFSKAIWSGGTAGVEPINLQSLAKLSLP